MDQRRELLQIAEISRNGCNLWLGQTMRDRFHNGRCVRPCRILTTLFAPVHQFFEGVVVELTCQTRKCALTFSLWAVTGLAWRNIGARNALLVDFFPRGHAFYWSTTQRLWIEVSKIRSQGRYHRRAQHMRHVEHHRVRSSALDKGPQLVFEVLRLLPRESRH